MIRESTQLSYARESFELRDGEAQVWAVSLDPDENRLQGLEAVLSSDERERAGRFAFSLHGKRFVAARGVLRTILARYAGADPADIRFSYGPHGKPFLSPSAGRDELHFNVSHAGDRALVAVTGGVDRQAPVRRGGRSQILLAARRGCAQFRARSRASGVVCRLLGA